MTEGGNTKIIAQQEGDCDSRLGEERTGKILKITCGKSWKHFTPNFGVN